jgi:hypothetical protein
VRRKCERFEVFEGWEGTQKAAGKFVNQDEALFETDHHSRAAKRRYWLQLLGNVAMPGKIRKSCKGRI